jgi:hypothetical protein
MLVTVTTFACFVTLQGEELTTAVAFTALSLFTMLRECGFWYSPGSDQQG